MRLLLPFLLLQSSAVLVTAAVEGNTEICASPQSKAGNRAVACGASNPDRPAYCCPGYKCNGQGSVTCTSGEDSDDEEAGNTSVGKQVAANAEIPFLPTTTTADDPELCAGWRDKARDCGHADAKKNKCCPGYECSPEEGKITCIAARKEFEPLREADPFIQKKPIQINSKITIAGTNFAAEADSKALEIDIPGEATDGDMLLLFVGGSAGSKRPEAPGGWELIKMEGKADLNMMSLYKWYDEGKDGTLSIGGGKNIFAILSVVQGVDRKKPLVDSAAVRESAPGKDGRAVAPSAFGIERGVNIAAFVFDDPQRAQLLTDGYDTLATTDTGRGDGMAVFAASTDATGYFGAVHVAGSPQSGGGNDVTMTVSLRPDGGPYDDPPPMTPKPTSAPTSLRPTASVLQENNEPIASEEMNTDEKKEEDSSSVTDLDYNGDSSAACVNRSRAGVAGALLAPVCGLPVLPFLLALL